MNKPDVTQDMEEGSVVESLPDAEPVANGQPLTGRDVWNLVWCLLAWGFTVSIVTMVVGTSAVLVLSLGGSNSIASMPLGSFFLGASAVSLTITPWIFPHWGRKRGLFTGIAFGLLGTALGAVAVKVQSPGLYVISTFCFGMATGLGFALRFAAVEVVPPSWASRAVTLVVSGGVIAAFAGPEASAATRDIFGEDLTYMGVFLMTGIFSVCNLVCTALVTFPDQTKDGKDTPSPVVTPLYTTLFQIPGLWDLMNRRQFWVPMLVAVVGWAAMGMPMSLVRVAMDQVGYSTTESLRVIELHFLAMYAPGFFTGNLIKALGPKAICYLAVAMFGLAQALAFLPDVDESDNIWMWASGLIFVGIGWNFCFTASTVWLLQKGPPESKATLQAANDCLMFLLAGAGLFASSYIYEAGSSDEEDQVLDGWFTLNWVVIGLNGFMLVMLLVDAILDRGVPN